MLKIDPNDRPTIEEVMDDPWFNAPTKRRRPPASTPSKRLSPTVSAPTKRRRPPAASADTDEDFDSRAYSTSSGYVGDEAGEHTDLGNDSGNESDVEACIEALIEATVKMLDQVSSCDEQISDCDYDDLGDLLDDTEPRTSICEH